MLLRQALRQLLSSFSIENLRARLLGQGGRQLQQELDTHKLFLYTTLHEKLKSGMASVDPQQILAESASVGYAAQVLSVRHLLRQQVLEMACCIHTSLLDLGDPAAAAAAFADGVDHEVEKQGQGAAVGTSSGATSGLAYAGMAATETAAAAQCRLQVTLGAVSQAAGQKLGFRLGVRRSSIRHGEAGDGLFVEEGQVSPGQMVALFPGLVYTKASYPAMPNYPKVDADNPYLIARYDRSVIDSKPWGRGLCAPSTWPQLTSPAAQHLRMLEGRHPYALAHYANHPGAGMQPNTLIAPFEVPSFHPAPPFGADLSPSASNGDTVMALLASGSGKSEVASTLSDSSAAFPLPSQPSDSSNLPGKPDADLARGSSTEAEPPKSLHAQRHLRAYMPNLMHSSAAASTSAALVEEVGAVALVASQVISEGQEVLFDYRLSPGLGRPDWYVAVDQKAELRRWS